MTPEEKRQKIRERLKMTQAEKWLAKKKPPKPIHSTTACSFNDQIQGRTHGSYKGCW